MSYEYKNKNGETFGIVTAESGTMAYINGSYVAQAETEKGILTEAELEEILDHFSHADISETLRYIGAGKGKTAD